MMNSAIEIKTKNIKRIKRMKTFQRYKMLYLFCLIPVLYLLIFSIIPQFGIVIAFQKYVPSRGILESEFVGLRYFKALFGLPKLPQLVFNTVIINIYKIIFVFPLPIILALMLNEVKSTVYKRFVQTVTYLPHFLSWAIIAGMVYNLLNYKFGIVNGLLESINLERVPWYQSPQYWRGIVVASSAWQSVGWGSIVYLAALCSIPAELYEAAIMDGAGKIQQIWHISIPCIMPIALIMFLFTIGGLVSGDFSQLFALVRDNTNLYPTVDVLDTYLYRIFRGNVNDISQGTAIGLVQSIIGVSLTVTANAIVRKYDRQSALW